MSATIWPWNHWAVAAFLGFALGYIDEPVPQTIALVLLLLHATDMGEEAKP